MTCEEQKVTVESHRSRVRKSRLRVKSKGSKFKCLYVSYRSKERSIFVSTCWPINNYINNILTITFDSRPRLSHPQTMTLDMQSSTCNPRPSTCNPRLVTLYLRPSTCYPRPSIYTYNAFTCSTPIMLLPAVHL